MRSRIGGVVGLVRLDRAGKRRVGCFGVPEPFVLAGNRRRGHPQPGSVVTVLCAGRRIRRGGGVALRRVAVNRGSGRHRGRGGDHPADQRALEADNRYGRHGLWRCLDCRCGRRLGRLAINPNRLRNRGDERGGARASFVRTRTFGTQNATGFRSVFGFRSAYRHDMGTNHPAMVYNITMTTLRSRKSAFTLIELILAVSVVVIMTAVAIPSFSTMNRGNDWNSGIQQITSCINTAQRQAASPTIGQTAGTLRYTAVKFTFSSGTLSCQDSTFSDVNGVPPNLATNGVFTSSGSVPLGSTGMLTNVISDTAKILAATTHTCSVTNLSPLSTSILYFSVAEGGRPVAYNNCNVIGAIAQTDLWSIGLQKDSNSTDTISVPGIGSPITTN